MNPLGGGWIVALSILMAMFLSIAPLPFEFPESDIAIRPLWIYVATFYWAIYRPERLSMVSLWIFALFLDVLLNEPLGLNGLCLVFLVFIANQSRGWLLSGSSSKQVVFLMLLSFGLSTVRSFTLSVTDDRDADFINLLSQPFITGLLWLPVFHLLNRIGGKYVQS